MVAIQDERSQHKNRAKALTILRSRVMNSQREAEQHARASLRRGQIGSGARHERYEQENMFIAYLFAHTYCPILLLLYCYYLLLYSFFPSLAPTPNQQNSDL